MSKLINPTLFHFILILLSILALLTKAQGKGSISGSVVDSESGEILIGVTVIVEGTNLGAVTDVEGKYLIKNINPGNYTLRFSYVSFSPVTIQNVVVTTDQQTKIDIQLKSESQLLNEVVISAEMLKSNENSILKIQKNAVNIMDAISSELIKKNNSSDGTDVLKRMTGVAIADGKYAFIRGVSDRYNNTLLNGSNLPSTDPEKKSFSYDIFPSSMIENVMTAKTFTPDKPADFSGGLVQINTIDFPSQFFLNVSASSSYNTNTSLKSFVTYNGGKTDFIGIDDGTRDKPTSINGDRLVVNDEQLKSIGLSFKNNWGTFSKKAPLNSSYKFSGGSNFSLGESSLGIVGSLSYSNNEEIKSYEKTSYTFDGPRYDYDGTIYNNSILWGALLNLSYKFAQNNKISLKNIFNQTTDDDIVVNAGDYEYTGQYRQTTAMRYVSRTLYSTQLLGEHVFPSLNSSAINWNLSYGISKRNEPDARRYVYARDITESDTPLRFLLDQSLTTRFYGMLDDEIYSFSSDFTIKPFENKNAPSLKTGILFDKKNRTFDARIFGFRNRKPNSNVDLTAPIEEIFIPENFENMFIQVREISLPSDSYESDQTVLGGYAMFDATLLDNIKLVGGVRYEKSKQHLLSRTTTNSPVDISPEYNDWLPAINLTYLFNDKINIRAAYSKTLARPEFRELAPYSYYDFITSESVKGNTKLVRSLIENYDLRFEFYPDLGELFAVSFFYKYFKNPIEQVYEQASGFEATRTYANAPDADNYGIEFEVRKSFNFISESLRDLSFVGNLSLIKSKVTVDSSYALGFAKSERPMQGQSDYIINVGLYYDNNDYGFSGSVVYNKVGDRITQVGFINVGDIIERPRDLLDLSLSKRILGNFNLSFSAKDILHQDQIYMQKRPGSDKIESRYRKGQNYSFGVSYSF